jgi:hypothetical protein
LSHRIKRGLDGPDLKVPARLSGSIRAVRSRSNGRREREDTHRGRKSFGEILWRGNGQRFDDSDTLVIFGADGEVDELRPSKGSSMASLGRSLASSCDEGARLEELWAARVFG